MGDDVIGWESDIIGPCWIESEMMESLSWDLEWFRARLKLWKELYPDRGDMDGYQVHIHIQSELQSFATYLSQNQAFYALILVTISIY